MEDDLPLEPGEHRGRLGVGGAGMDDDGLAEVVGERELALEQVELAIARGVVAVEVEAGLAHGDRPRVCEELAQLVEALRIVAARRVGMDAEDRPDALVPVGERRGRSARRRPWWRR